MAAVIQGGLCFAIQTQTPIATGLADFVARDNNTFFEPGTRADAFGWTAKGDVIGASDGVAYSYKELLTGVLASDGLLVTVQRRITLKQAK